MADADAFHSVARNRADEPMRLLGSDAPACRPTVDGKAVHRMERSRAASRPCSRTNRNVARSSRPGTSVSRS